MIVNPPRSEAEFTSRLRTISTQAADKFDDPDDRPPLISRELRRQLVAPGLAVLLGLVIWGGLALYTYGPAFLATHATKAEEFRALARQSEQQARSYRSFVASAPPSTVPGGGPSNVWVSYQSLATQMEQQAASYRKQAYLEERRAQGFPTP